METTEKKRRTGKEKMINRRSRSFGIMEDKMEWRREDVFLQPDLAFLSEG